MHKGDTIPGLITAIFGYSVAIYTLLEDTMRVNAQSSDGVPGAGFFPVLLGFAVGILVCARNPAKRIRAVFPSRPRNQV